MSKNPLICIAVCSGAFGVKGEVKIKSFTAIAEDCFSYGPLRGEDGEVLLTVVSHRPITKAFAARFKEATTPERARALNNTELFVYRSDMPEPDEDEFYFEDLVGLSVKTTDGKRMGKIMAVHNYGAGDLLEISGGKDKKGNPTGEFFHAFTKKAVPKVDVKGGAVVIFIEQAIIAKEK